MSLELQTHSSLFVCVSAFLVSHDNHGHHSHERVNISFAAVSTEVQINQATVHLGAQ